MNSLRQTLARLAPSAFGLLFSTTAVVAQVAVNTEVDFGLDRETTGTFVFATVPSNSSSDLANGLTFDVLAGSPNPASGAIAVLTDGGAQTNFDSVPESFFATDNSTNIRIQVKLQTIHEIGQINTFSWHRNSRSRQQYRVYVALAPTNAAPNFSAAAFQDDAALAALGYTAVASVDTGSHSGGQAGVGIAGRMGLNQYVLFDIEAHFLSNVYRSTFFGEIDIFDTCQAVANNYGTGLAGSRGVPSLLSSAAPVVGNNIDLLASNSSGAPSSGLIVAGLQAVAVPFLGGELLADTLVLRAAPMPAAGLALPIVVPTVPCGTEVFLQVLQLDQAAVAGVAMTPGLRLNLGN